MYDDYFYWLTGLLNYDYILENYEKLLRLLMETEFTWTVEYDGNRAADGLYLRRLYLRQTGQFCRLERECSVLEMLIALCRRCEDELMYDPDLGDRTGYWFMIILTNLGLNLYDDYHFDCDSVDTIVERFLDRDYEMNGMGGPFPCAVSEIDFRKKDLWWQLNAFLGENYPL